MTDTDQITAFTFFQYPGRTVAQVVIFDPIIAHPRVRSWGSPFETCHGNGTGFPPRNSVLLQSVLFYKCSTHHLNLLVPELFFLILAHSVYKIRIIQEPNTLELLNQLHYKERNKGQYIPCLKYSVPIFVE